jgi:hypothetical protein
MAGASDPTPTDRREFLKLLGVAGIGSTLATSAVALAQTSKTETKEDAKPKPQPVAPAQGEQPETSPDARTLLEVVKRRYGSHLTDEQLAEILEELNGRMRSGEALRKLALTNGDEPDVIFSA